MHINFHDQVVLVTGGSRGIGAAIVREFVASGAQVIVTATQPMDAAVVQEKFGPQASCLAVDFSSRESTDIFLQHLKSLPRLDVCVNNAGLARHALIDVATRSDWELTQRVNLEAPFLVLQAAREIMKRRGYGRIINIGSVLGHIGRAEKAAYTAAKTGLIGLTRVAAVEFAVDGILVNEVSPGLTATDLLKTSYSSQQLAELAAHVPLRRIGDPKDIARVVLFLASAENSFMTGQSIVVDGGSSIV